MYTPKDSGDRPLVSLPGCLRTPSIFLYHILPTSDNNRFDSVYVCMWVNRNNFRAEFADSVIRRGFAADSRYTRFPMKRKPHRGASIDPSIPPRGNSFTLRSRDQYQKQQIKPCVMQRSRTTKYVLIIMESCFPVHIDCVRNRLQCFGC